MPKLLATLLTVIGALLGCASTPEAPPLPQEGLARTPEVVTDPVTGERSTEITVLIYNVAGLPWPIGCGKSARMGEDERIPIRCNRSAALKAIGDELGAMRSRGEEPDIVLIQEGFIDASFEIPARGGYPNWVAGPASGDEAPKVSQGVERSFVDERQFWRGEKLGKVQSSGLFILSNFPIVEAEKRPFKEWECAGFDCLANKGLLLVRVRIPGVPQLVELLTTHLNARKASGVSLERSLRAHNLQIDEVDDFLQAVSDERLPIIWGGDLNMRNARDRLDYLVSKSEDPILEVSSYCLYEVDDCDVPFSWGSDEPWLDTQDLQGWAPGEIVKVRPVAVDTLFDQPVDAKMPSDHIGVVVRYRLSWMPEGG